MWSGPRNLSTAMMYAFGARSDCAIWDEPFYAAYLAATGLDHPMRSEIMAAGRQNPADVVQACLGATPDDKQVFYQKHMTQHMLPSIERGWINDCVNVFLIRDPARVIASYAARRESPSLDDIGFRQQAELFDQICQKQSTPPPVLDSVAIRANPEKILRKLCGAIGLEFQPTMLSWATGGHKDDGVWARHWYGAVHNSTGFSAVEGPLPEVDGNLRKIWEQALPYYQLLQAHQI